MSRPDDYRSPPPPGQGYYNQYPESGYDDRFETGPRTPRDPGYVPYQNIYNHSGPPPRDAYPPRDSPSRESFVSGGPPRSQYGYARREERSYASSPRPGSMNQMAAYDYNKAYAQEQDHWQYQEQQRTAYTHGRPPPPPSTDYGYDSRQDSRRRSSEDSYDDRDYYYERERRERSRRRRYSDDDYLTEKYASDPQEGGKDVHEGDSGRSLAANLAGLAAGGFFGNRLGRGGAIGTISGAALGAIGAQIVERQYTKRQQEKVVVADPHAVPAGR